MAVPMVKTTYSLDEETIRALERIARRWGVSRSEALRRVIRGASAPSDGDGRLQALDDLQRSLDLDARQADGWVRRVRAERRASARRTGGRSG